VRYPGRWIREPVHLVFDRDIRAGQPAVVLPQVLVLGRYRIRLQELVGSLPVSIELPANRSRPEPG
jgi:hypothetical protein